MLTSGTAQQAAGLNCQPRLDLLGTICVATDGQMKSAYPLVLSRESEQGIKMKATHAALDLKADEAVFAPHLQGGFAIQASKP